MMQQSVSALRMFYWQVEFTDGTKVSQFDNDGNEIYLRDFISIEARLDPQDPSKGYDLKKNVLANLETIHGDCIKVSWMPFTYRLKQNIIKKQPHVNIEVVNENKAIERRIPDGFYAHWFSSAQVDYATNFLSPSPLGLSARITELYLGYLPRPGNTKKGEIDRIIIAPRLTK